MTANQIAGPMTPVQQSQGLLQMDPEEREQYLQFKQYQQQKLLLEMKLQEASKIKMDQAQAGNAGLNSILDFSEIQVDQSLDEGEAIFDDKVTNEKETHDRSNDGKLKRSGSKRSQINDVLNLAKEQQK